MADEISGAAPTHGPGTFTHNNKDILPGQMAGSVREQQSPDHAPDVGQSFDRQVPERSAVSLIKDRSSFMQARQSHQPLPEHSMHTTLPHSADVDRATFRDLQAQEDRAATKGQRRSTERERLYPPTKPEPMAKAEFMRVRTSAAPSRSQDYTRNR